MGKNKARKRQPTAQEKPRKAVTPWLGRLSHRAQIMLCLAFLLLLVLVYHAPMVFGGKSPAGEDVIGGKGRTHQISEYEKQTGHRALWNPYVFSGMPVYHRASSVAVSLDTLLGFLYNTRGREGAVYFLVGAFGMFLLLKYLSLQNLSALLGAVTFLFIPHWQGLLQAGHFAKFRPIMMMPWVLLAFMYLLDRRSLLSWLCFVLTFSVQLRTQHYQVVFYTGILMFFMGIRYGLRWLREKAYIRTLKAVGKTLGAIGVVAMMVAQPLWVAKEYTPYSIRGGTGEQGSTGVDFSYATNWSFAPKEMFTLLMPRFFGGTSNQRYTGSAVPALKGKAIPGYWGDMPFSGNTEYLGIVAVILAAIGFYVYRKDGFVRTLILLIVFSLLLSFGRHFPAFYGIFFKYMPAFNKFRVPSMILLLVMFSISVIAAYGLDSLIQAEKARRRQLQRVTLWIGGVLLLIGLVPFLFKGVFPFERPGEAEHYGRTMEYLRAARYDLMKTDAIRLILFAILTCGLMGFYLANGPRRPMDRSRPLRLRKNVLVIGMMGLVLADLISVGNQFLTKDHLANAQQLERTYFAKSDVDEFLLKDQDIFRIFPVGGLFSSNHWSYYHQSIGGYDPAKLRITQDVVESCLYTGWDAQVPINWNVVNMLNVKYLITKGQIPDSPLQLVYRDQRTGHWVYQNSSVLPRAFFVGHYEVIPKREDRLARLNDKSFDPSKTAILEFDPKVDIAVPDADAGAKITLFEPDRIILEAHNPKDGLLVLSEIYYPKGWHAYIDGQETNISKTNHVLRSIFVPGGTHHIEFRFQPASYFRNVRISRYSTYIIYLLLLAALGRWFVQKRRTRLWSSSLR